MYSCNSYGLISVLFIRVCVGDVAESVPQSVSWSARAHSSASSHPIPSHPHHTYSPLLRVSSPLVASRIVSYRHLPSIVGPFHSLPFPSLASVSVSVGCRLAGFCVCVGWSSSLMSFGPSGVFSRRSASSRRAPRRTQQVGNDDDDDDDDDDGDDVGVVGSSVLCVIVGGDRVASSTSTSRPQAESMRAQAEERRAVNHLIYGRMNQVTIV